MPYLTGFLILSLFFSSPCGNKKKENVPGQEIRNNMKKAAEWQINNFNYKTEGNLHDYGIDAWTNGVLYVGMLEWAKMAYDSAPYFKWLSEIGEKNNWSIPANFENYPRYSLYHADELCVGQFYLGMYDIYKKPQMLASTKNRVDWIIENPGDSIMSYKNKQWWTWCDALFMAPPVYAHMYMLTGNESYVDFMDKEFRKTYDHLYDKEYNLFFRDDSFFDKREANGKKIFWGRGNGWAAAGLVNLLKILPSGSSYRPFYEELLKKFVSQLVQYQDTNGFWHASLLDPDSYPSPETSATALITYALAYGINQGLLSRTEYYEPALKGWNALVSALGEDGKLGWVQPIGADPKKVTADMTAVYGVGAFLLAGTEMNRLMDN